MGTRIRNRSSELHKKHLMRMDTAQLVELVMEKEREIEALNAIAGKYMKREEELLQKLDLLNKVRETSKSYNKAWPWVTKLVYVLMENDKPMQAREIGIYLAKKESQLVGKTDVARMLSPYLCNGCSTGRIMSHKVAGIKGHYYILPKWLDESGRLMDAYAEKVDMLV